MPVKTEALPCVVPAPAGRRRRARKLRLAVMIALPAVLYVLAVVQAAAIVAKKATDARHRLIAAESHVRAGDLDAARAELQIAARDISVTRSGLIRAVLGPPKFIPVIGRSFTAVDAMTAAAVDVMDGARVIVDSLAPVMTPSTLKIEGGRIPKIPWEDITRAAARAGESLDEAGRKVGTISTSGVPGRIRLLRSSLNGEIARSRDALQRLALGAKAAGRIFDGDKTVLVILQNSSELRATGGYLDDMLSFRIERGRFKIESIHFDNGMTASQVHEFRQLLTDPDFPTSAHDVATFAARVWGIRSDLVLSLDTAGVAAVLDVTGPIAVDGLRLDRKSYPRWSTVAVYQQHPDATDRHIFEGRVIAKLMERLLSRSSSFTRLGSVFGAMAREKHLLFWSPDHVVQDAFTRLDVGASFAPVEGEATLGVFGNALDQDWSKLAPFAHRRIGYRGTLAADGTLRATVTVEIANDVPDLPRYLLGPRRDYVYRTLVTVPGFTRAPVQFDAPRGGAARASFSASFKTAPGQFLLHYFRQPLLSADELDVSIVMPPGIRPFGMKGFTFAKGSLTFRGPVSTDLILSAGYPPI